MFQDTASPLPQIDDTDLLRAFAVESSESAFRAIVDRHASWVFAAAYRRLRDQHLAEDATQAVFILLCQRAKQMKPQQRLSGWLFLATRFTTQSILRSRRRRGHHEKLAAAQRPAIAPEAPTFAGDLDDAVAALSEADRTAIILRFYRQLEFDAIAKTLGISAEAAKKRVSRAIRKMRRRLGTQVTAEALTAAAAFGAPADPSALCSHVSHIALTTAGGGAAPAGVASALKGAGLLMALTKANIAAVVATILITCAAATVAVWQIAGPPESQMPNPLPPASPAPIAAADSSQSFEQAYALAGNQVLRWVQRPFIPARLDFYRKQNRAQANAVPRGPDAMIIAWRNGKPNVDVSMFSNGQSGFEPSALIEYVLRVYPQDVKVDTTI